ncbi:MAG: sulfotransferase domain-containing protein [Anaerolineae bacterium]
MALSQRLLINSMPKSGTHLLTQVVDLLGFQDQGAHASFWGRTKDRLGLGAPVVLAHLRVKRNKQRLLRSLVTRQSAPLTVPVDVTMPVDVPVGLLQAWLAGIRPGAYLSGHVPWHVKTADIVRANALKQIVIVRDPRDVLVSFVHFVRRPQHVLSKDFTPLTPDEQLLLALQGGQGSAGTHIVGMMQGFAAILNWTQETDVLFVRFEDLIGTQGAGSEQAQRVTVQKIAEYLGLALTDQATDTVCQRAFDTKSATFRRGQIGSWQDELTPQQIQSVQDGFTPLRQTHPWVFAD